MTYFDSSYEMRAPIITVRCMGLCIKIRSVKCTSYHFCVICSTDEKAAGSGRSRKSKSAEATFHDSADPEFLADVVKQLCVRLSEELIAANLRGRLLTLKVRTFDEPRGGAKPDLKSQRLL